MGNDQVPAKLMIILLKEVNTLGFFFSCEGEILTPSDGKWFASE